MKTELNNEELVKVNGGESIINGVVKIVFKTCKKCGKRYTMFENHTCFELPKMDVDNRPPIDTTLLGPKLPQE